MKNFVRLAIVCGALAAFRGTAQIPITYVDATDGVSGNTLTYSNGAWQVFMPLLGQTAVNNDGIWDKRVNIGNSASIYQNAGPGVVDTREPHSQTPRLPANPRRKRIT